MSEIVGINLLFHNYLCQKSQTKRPVWVIDSGQGRPDLRYLRFRIHESGLAGSKSLPIGGL